MEISTSKAVTYVGAGAAVGAGFAALKHGSVRSAALGLATGLVASGAQVAAEGYSGVSELGWGASIVGGAAAGAVLLGGLGPASATPLSRRGVGAVVGAAAGLLAPVAAGIVLAQFQGA